MLSIQDEDGNLLPPGETGEVCARGGNYMIEYWNKQDATAEAFRGGWYHTGDAGYLDEDGYLYLVDRVKDMIVTGGENVYSIEVENAISTHPGGGPGRGDRHPARASGARRCTPSSCCATAPRRRPTRSSRTRASRIAGYKVPKSVEFRAEPLPLSGAMKVLKRELREPYWAGRSAARELTGSTGQRGGNMRRSPAAAPAAAFAALLTSRPLPRRPSEESRNRRLPDLGVVPRGAGHFLRGVAALHSFGWKQAIAEFEAAQKIEPDFAMPYWGQSLCYNHPLFSELDPKQPREALAKLGADAAARAAKAPTDREKGFLAAVEALWGEGTSAERKVAYFEAMDRLHQSFPTTTRWRRSTRWRNSPRRRRSATTICARTSAPARSRSTSSRAAPTIPAPRTT